MGRLLIAIALGCVIVIFGGAIWFNRLLAVGVAAVAVLVVSLLYHTYLTAPECDADEVTFAVSKDISQKFPAGGVTVRNVQTVTGGFFSSRNSCEMEVAPMAGFGGGAAQSWSQVAYSTSWSGSNLDVEVQSVSDEIAGSSVKPAD